QGLAGQEVVGGRLLVAGFLARNQLREDEDAGQVGEHDGDVQRREFHSGSSRSIGLAAAGRRIAQLRRGRWNRGHRRIAGILRAAYALVRGPALPSTPDSAVLSVAAAALSNAPPCGPGGCPRPPRRGAWLLGPGHAQGAAATALQQSFARNIGPGCPPVAACGAGARHRPRVSPYSP